MAALSGIAIINQKPTVMAELMVAMVNASWPRCDLGGRIHRYHASVGYLVHNSHDFTHTPSKRPERSQRPHQELNLSHHPAAMLRTHAERRMPHGSRERSVACMSPV